MQLCASGPQNIRVCWYLLLMIAEQLQKGLNAKRQTPANDLSRITPQWGRLKDALKCRGRQKSRKGANQRSQLDIKKKENWVHSLEPDRGKKHKINIKNRKTSVSRVKRARRKTVLVTVCLGESCRLQRQVKSKNVQGLTDIQDAYRFGGEGTKENEFKSRGAYFFIYNSSKSTGTSTGILRPRCSPQFPQSSIHFIYEV